MWLQRRISSIWSSDFHIFEETFKSNRLSIENCAPGAGSRPGDSGGESQTSRVLISRFEEAIQK